MKRVVDGKVIDTDKAMLIGRATPADGVIGCASCYSESLYMRPRSKDFFLIVGNGTAHAMRQIDAHDWMRMRYGVQAADAALTLASSIVTVPRRKRAMDIIASLDK